MICFITENTGEWTGVFYAVDNDEFVDIQDEHDPEFFWRGLVAGEEKVLIHSTNFHATHIIVKDKDLNKELTAAMNGFIKGQLAYRDENENIYTVSIPEVLWAKYRIYIAYDSE